MQERVIVGIDLSDSYTQICYQKDNMKTPISVSAITGSDRYLIPTVIARKTEIGQWFIGDEAQKTTYALKCTDLLSKAERKESVFLDGIQYQCTDLLTLFLNKLLFLVTRNGYRKDTGFLSITVNKVDDTMFRTLKKVMEDLKIEKERYGFYSYNESFGNYVMQQSGETRLHDILLYELWDTDLFSRYIKVYNKTTPVLLVPQEQEKIVFKKELSEHYDLLEEEKKSFMDQLFTDIIREDFKQGCISSIYLVGPKFQEDWMKDSLVLLASNRKAFRGNNLFVKGACFAAAHDEQQSDYIILDESVCRYNFFIKARYEHSYQYLTLLSAGTNVEKAQGTLDVILEQEEEIQIEITDIFGDEKPPIVIPIAEILSYDSRKRRIRITVGAKSISHYNINVYDLQFGRKFEERLIWTNEVVEEESL